MARGGEGKQEHVPDKGSRDAGCSLCPLPSPPAPRTPTECGTGRILPEHPLPPGCGNPLGWDKTRLKSPQIPSCGEQPCPVLLLDGDGFRLTGRRSFYQEELQLLEQLCCPQLPRKDPKPKGEWQDFISSSSLFPQFLMDAVSTFMLSENGCFTAA